MRVHWKNFELPTRVVLDEASATNIYGKFAAEPFERGFGTTIRTLLQVSDAEGLRIRFQQPVTSCHISAPSTEIRSVPEWKPHSGC